MFWGGLLDSRSTWRTYHQKLSGGDGFGVGSNGHVTDNTEVTALKLENFSVTVKSRLALLTQRLHFSVLLCRRGRGHS